MLLCFERVVLVVRLHCVTGARQVERVPTLVAAKAQLGIALYVKSLDADATGLVVVPAAAASQLQLSPVASSTGTSAAGDAAPAHVSVDSAALRSRSLALLRESMVHGWSERDLRDAQRHWGLDRHAGGRASDASDIAYFSDLNAIVQELAGYGRRDVACTCALQP